MAYRVSLSIPAETDAYATLERIREAAPMHTGKWLVNLFAAIGNLEEAPSRCPAIAEADGLGFPARRLLCSKGRDELSRHCPRIESAQHQDGQGLSVVRRDSEGSTATA